MKKYLTALALLMGASGFAEAAKHPLDGLSKDEIASVPKILQQSGKATKESVYPLIELIEPNKYDVLNGKKTARKVFVNFVNKNGFQEATVNLDTKKVESLSKATGKPMIMFGEFMSSMMATLGSPDFQKALKKRNLTPDDVFCLPLTAGNFGDASESGKSGRTMKVPCYMNPAANNFYAKPIENLFAVTDLETGKVVKVVDEGVLPVPKDAWGYDEDSIAKRTELRKKMNPAKLHQKGAPNYTLKDGVLEWDIWRMRLRVEKRPGLVLSNIDVKDKKKWRSVMYQAHLSEVFVPYMDPSAGWYWRTYMDSGEYGFGLFLSPLRANIDCPSYATFLPAVINDDTGNSTEIPDAICIFERNVGDPAWRHFEIFAQDPEKGVFTPAEGRPATELVVRTASEVGNYDYLIDYRFKQDGGIDIKIGSTGLDAVKGTKITHMSQQGAKEATKHGTLIAPYLVGPDHSHFFNFKLDFDLDGHKNSAMKLNIVRAKPDNSPRTSMWTVQRKMITSEKEGTFKLNAQKPSMLMLMNMDKKNYLGNPVGFMIKNVSVGATPDFDFDSDMSMKRNAYVKYQIWNTKYDANERYAGGKYAMGSDGNDTLATWINKNRKLNGQDIVTWVTAGFHHVTRSEDWPVMPLNWKSIKIRPMNFFDYNPAITIRNPE